VRRSRKNEISKEVKEKNKGKVYFHRTVLNSQYICLDQSLENSRVNFPVVAPDPEKNLGY
jgi:hypothetical protein